MMALPRFIRRILGAGSFPRLVGQDLPGPVAKGKTAVTVNPAMRSKTLGLVDPVKLPKP